MKHTAAKQCLVLLFALIGAACSNTNSRGSNVNRSALPVSPVQQPTMRAPRNIYVPSEFGEYRPRQPVYNNQPRYEEYVPEKDYRDSYTTAIERQPPAVVEVLKPEPIAIQPAEPETPVEVVKKEEDYSRNELDIDPFADVPEREVLAMTSKPKAAPAPQQRSVKPMSRAAKVLSLAARAESAAGRNDAAINKIERALRIEPQSPELWHQLATLNFKKGQYDQAIGFARKALPLASGRRDLVEKNLDLMSKAAVKSGNTKVFKEVLDYKKQNL